MSNEMFKIEQRLNKIVLKDCSKELSGNFVIPQGITYIEWSAFRGCENITSIEMPNSVKEIGTFAFKNCKCLSKINIPDSVVEISHNAFIFCDSLPVEDGLRYADSYLIGVVDKDKTLYTIKEGTKWIGEYAFASDSFMEAMKEFSIIMPTSVERFDKSAFDNSNLRSITIQDFIKKPSSTKRSTINLTLVSDKFGNLSKISGVLKVHATRQEINDEELKLIMEFFNKHFDPFESNVSFEAPELCKEVSIIPGYIKVMRPNKYNMGDYRRSHHEFDEYVDINTKYIVATDVKNIDCTTLHRGCQITLACDAGDRLMASCIVYEGKEDVDQKIKESLEQLSLQVGGAAGLLNELGRLTNDNLM